MVQMMFIGFVGGIYFALSEEAMCWIFGTQLDLTFPQRSFAYAITASFWLPAGSVVSRNIARYNRVHKEFREQLLQQESVKIARNLALEEYKKKIENQIQDDLKVTSNEASELLLALEHSDSRRMPEHLRIISHEYFSITGRSLSKNDGFKSLEFSKMSIQISILLRTLVESIRTRPLNPVWFATIVAATVIPAFERSFLFIQVLQIVFLIFASVYLIQKSQVLCIRYLNLWPFPALIIFTLASIIFPEQSQIFRGGAYVFLILTATVLGHLAQAGLLRYEDFTKESAAELSRLHRNEREVNTLFLQITKDWARHIHGSITSKLESAAFEIENSLKDDDLVAVGKAIERVKHYLKSDSTLRKSSQGLLLDEIYEKVAPWNGILEIEIDSNISREELVSVSTQEVGHCIEEAILNAARHGECSTMNIELSNNASTFRVVCSDNGIGPGKILQGLGFSIYAQATKGNWTLRRDTFRAMTVLTLDFPKNES